MNKKQEKAEMIKLIGNVKPFYVETIAKALYDDAGYRKVDDVRKETAKEILSRIKLYATDSKTDLIVLIDEIAEANGVEVGE